MVPCECADPDFTEGPEVITFREHLVTAIDFILGSGTEDRAAIAAAKAMQRKVCKIGAKLQAPGSWAHYCDCGERKETERVFCQACFAVIPMRLWLQYHTARRRRDSSEAFRKMVTIAQTRIHMEKAA